jgi:hypothetical protein
LLGGAYRKQQPKAKDDVVEPLTEAEQESLRVIADGLDAKRLKLKIPHLRLSAGEQAYAEALVAEKELKENEEAHRQQLHESYLTFTRPVLEQMMESPLLMPKGSLERAAAKEVVKQMKQDEAEAKKKEKEDIAFAKRMQSGRLTRSSGVDPESDAFIGTDEVKQGKAKSEASSAMDVVTMEAPPMSEASDAGDGVKRGAKAKPAARKAKKAKVASGSGGGAAAGGGAGALSPSDFRASIISSINRRRHVAEEWEQAGMTWTREEIEEAIKQLSPDSDAEKVSSTLQNLS